MENKIKIAIAGIPKAGKTTLSKEISNGEVFHTDDLIKTKEWSAASLEISTWFNKEGPFIIEGVAVPRALRKWLRAHEKGKPCDKLIWLKNPYIKLSPGQETMAKGCIKVMDEIKEELRGRGVEIMNKWENTMVVDEYVDKKIGAPTPKEKLKIRHNSTLLNKKEIKNIKNLVGKKKFMINALILNLGNVSMACKKVGIDRQTHYNWLKSDLEYVKRVLHVPEITLDFAENALLKNIKKGNVAAQIFYLKTKGKKRGYIERQEVEHIGDHVQKFELVDVDSPGDVKKLYVK